MSGMYPPKTHVSDLESSGMTTTARKNKWGQKQKMLMLMPLTVLLLTILNGSKNEWHKYPGHQGLEFLLMFLVYSTVVLSFCENLNFGDLVWWANAYPALI